MGRVKAWYQQLIDFNRVHDGEESVSMVVRPIELTDDEVNKLAQQAAEMDHSDQENA